MKKTLMILALCAIGIQMNAQTMQFLNIGTDAATSAVAGTGVARTATAYAIDNNMAAAALATSEMATEIGYGIWQPNASKTGIISATGYFQVSDKLAIGAGFKNFSEPEYSLTSADGRSNGSFKPSEMGVGLGAAYKLGDCLALGINAKFASSSLAENAKASTVAGDLSLAYTHEALQAGVAVCNIGGKASYSEGGSYSLPMIAKAGAAYSISGLTASAEFDYLLSGGLMAGIGAEYWIKDIVAVRAGYHYGDGAKAIPSYASAGLGFNLAGVKVNAAYLLASETLGGTMMFGLGYSF